MSAKKRLLPILVAVLMAFAMMAVFSLTFVSCGDNDEEKDKYGLININGENYVCWDYNSPFSLYSRWTNGNLIICFPVLNL